MSRWEVSADAADLHADALVWDMTLPILTPGRPEPKADLVARFARSGFDFATITLAIDAMDFAASKAITGCATETFRPCYGPPGLSDLLDLPVSLFLVESHRQFAPPAAHDRQVLGQDQQTEWNHPEAKHRQKAQNSADHQQDPQPHP